MPKISVIVPIYGAEKYIAQCAESLFSQTLDDIEYIFVDDCSPDDSIKILKDTINQYPERVLQVKIIRNKINLKQAASRSVGLRAAKGDYIIHCDPDDWVEENMYELLYNKAKSTDADIVACDFMIEREFDYEVYQTPCIKSPYECISKATLKSHWSLCNKLVRKRLIQDNEIAFIENINLWEDLCFMIRCYYFANKIEYVSKPLYHYNRNNEQSITNVLTKNKLEQQKRCIDFLEAFFVDKQDNFSGFIQMYKHHLALKEIYFINSPVLVSLRDKGYACRLLYMIINIPRKIKTYILIKNTNKKFTK